jgi:hypothetical protein
MNKYVVPPVCAAAAFALTTFVSFGADPLPDDGATYQQMDDNSYVQTESDSAGTYNVFYDRLAPEGRWFNDDDYGEVWQPNVAESTADWRPYADGHWVWTDRGWFWDSNEDFGWATYHYGRWILLAGVGWVWVPGDQWAPAWVSWRQTDDDDYVGWAPLPPEASFSVSVGFHPWCDTYYDIGPAAFAFIRIGDFCRPSYREFFAPPQQNLVLINRTTNVTNITYNNNVIYNHGPQYQRVSQLVQQRAGQQVPNYKINYAVQRQPDAAFKTAVRGNQLNVIAPPQKLKAVATTEPKVARRLGKAQVERGWQNVPQEQAQQLRRQFAQKAPVPQTLPAKPVLPAKPQVHAVTKGEQQTPGGPGKSPQGPNGLVEEKPAGQPGKKTTRQESSKPKKEELKREQLPGSQQGSASRHAEHVVAYQQPQRRTEKVEKSHSQQPAVHQAHANPPPHVVQAPNRRQAHPQPHPQGHPQPHGAANNNGKKKKDR